MTLATAFSPTAMAAVFDTSNDFFLVLGEDGRLLAANGPFRQRVLGDPLGLPGCLAECLEPGHAERLRSALRQVQHERSLTINLTHVTPDGQRRPVQYALFVNPQNPRTVLAVGRPEQVPLALDHQVESLTRRLTKLSRRIETLQRRLAEETTVDSLTALPTRREFDRLLVSEWHRAARLGLSLWLMAIDVDSLRRVNEQFGAVAGDRVLKAVGEFLRSNSRPYDVVARVKDDNFILMTVQRPSDGHSPGDLARRLWESFPKLPFDIAGPQPVHVTLSVGVATALPTSETQAEPAQLYQVALDALAKAKTAGGNCVHLAEPPLSVN